LVVLFHELKLQEQDGSYAAVSVVILSFVYLVMLKPERISKFQVSLENSQKGEGL
jgi:hypothetical protein